VPTLDGYRKIVALIEADSGGRTVTVVGCGGCGRAHDVAEGLARALARRGLSTLLVQCDEERIVDEEDGLEVVATPSFRASADGSGARATGHDAVVIHAAEIPGPERPRVDIEPERVVLVAQRGVTTKDELRDAVERVGVAGAGLLCVVLA